MAVSRVEDQLVRSSNILDVYAVQIEMTHATYGLFAKKSSDVQFFKSREDADTYVEMIKENNLRKEIKIQITQSKAAELDGTIKLFHITESKILNLYEIPDYSGYYFSDYFIDKELKPYIEAKNEDQIILIGCSKKTRTILEFDGPEYRHYYHCSLQLDSSDQANNRFFYLKDKKIYPIEFIPTPIQFDSKLHEELLKYRIKQLQKQLAGTSSGLH